MNRRKFIRAFAGAVATVAIGMRVSHGMPTIDFSRIGDPNIIAMKVKVNMDDRTRPSLDVEWVDWRAMYGTPV
jgi:hypothetical protein